MNITFKQAARFWIGAAVVLGTVTACSDADVASSNLSKAADNFEINRRVIFYNGVTGEYILRGYAHWVTMTHRVACQSHARSDIISSRSTTWGFRIT